MNAQTPEDNVAAGVLEGDKLVKRETETIKNFLDFFDF